MKEKLTGPLAGLAGCFVAGGAVTSLHTNMTINDFDIYPKSPKDQSAAIQWAFDDGWWNVQVSSKALTFKRGTDGDELQIVLGSFPTAETIFGHFDFTVCMGAFDLDTQEFILHKDFLLHCAQRYLKFNPDTKYPYASAWRVKKYTERGFTIGKMEMMKITLACANKKIETWQDLKEQIGGVYGESITIPDDTDFSMEKAYAAIASMKPAEEPAVTFSTPEIAIAALSELPIRYFVGGPSNNVFADIHVGEDHFVDIGKIIPKNGVKIDLVDALYPSRTFYKKAYRTRDGQIISAYKSTFEYSLTEETVSLSPYIYCHANWASAYNHYQNINKEHETVILELTALAEDINFTNIHNPPTLKKCRVTKVFSHEQWTASKSTMPMF